MDWTDNYNVLIQNPTPEGTVSQWVKIPARPHHKIGCFVERLDGCRVPICISAAVTAMEKEFPPEPQAYPSFSKTQIVDYGNYSGPFSNVFSW